MNLIPSSQSVLPFSVSIVLPVINETYSLLKSIQIIRESNEEDILEFILVVCSITSSESLKICQGLNIESPQRFVLIHQTLPFLGGALREAFAIARGTHTIMMASDMETDPTVVKSLIFEEQKQPHGIVTASRWIKGGHFENYQKTKLILNYLFQKFFSFLFNVRLSDLTFGFRIFPTRLIQAIEWEELNHSFLLETILKPIRLGIPVSEVPSIWRMRTEGDSQNTFIQNVRYVILGFRVRFYNRERITKQGFCKN